MVIHYTRQEITSEDIEEVVRVLKSDLLTQGPEIEKFENKICEITGANSAVAVTNGTAALHLATIALGVKSEDTVLCVANSFAASANCVRYCNAKVVFVDINPRTFCIDLNDLEQKIVKYKPVGAIVVHFGGYPINMEQISMLCEKSNIWLIEDCCHALGGWFETSRNVRSPVGKGNYSQLSTFSFHPAKHVAMGEGGAVSSSNIDLINKIKLLRTHGISKKEIDYKNKSEGLWYHEMQCLGFNYRVSDILCALGTSQMNRLSQNLNRRKEISKIYRDELSDLPIQFQQDHPGHAYHLMVGLIKERNKLYYYLREHNIFAQVHYIPIYKHPYYAELYGNQSLSHVEEFYSKALSLPMYHGLKDLELEKVISVIKRFFKK